MAKNLLVVPWYITVTLHMLFRPKLFKSLLSLLCSALVTSCFPGPSVSGLRPMWWLRNIQYVGLQVLERGLVDSAVTSVWLLVTGAGTWPVWAVRSLVRYQWAGRSEAQCLGGSTLWTTTTGPHSSQTHAYIQLSGTDMHKHYTHFYFPQWQTVSAPGWQIYKKAYKRVV